jgi:hypothetical protein
VHRAADEFVKLDPCRGLDLTPGKIGISLLESIHNLAQRVVIFHVCSHN